MAAEDNIKATMEELQKALSANSTIGTPMEMEDRIIVPITKTSFVVQLSFVLKQTHSVTTFKRV